MLVLIAGLVFGLFALNMDTSVATEPQNIGGIGVPSVRVNNIGLMDQRRNYLIASGVIAVVGVMLAVAGSLEWTITQGAAQDRDTRQCPYRAEDVKAEAIVCRFCGHDLPALPEPTIGKAAAQVAEPVDDTFDTWD